MTERYIATKLPRVPKRPAPKTAFKKGMKRLPGAGRKPGGINKVARLVKDAITGAGEKLGMLAPVYRYREERVSKTSKKFKRVKTDEIIGWKPTGIGGTEGYLMWLACNHPSAYASLLGRMLPLQINAKVDNNVTVTARFSNTDLTKMTLTERMAAMREMIGMTQPLPEEKQLEAPEPPDVTEGEFTEMSSYREAAE